MGVACDVAIKEGVDLDENQERATFTDRKTLFTYDKEKLNLPNSVREWLQLKDSEVYILSCLATMNDDGISFQEIADFIETEPRGLFDATSA